MPFALSDVTQPTCNSLLLFDIISGHGPFSHGYEKFVTKNFPQYFETLSDDIKAKYDALPSVPKDYCHEDVSMKMIDAALAHLGFEIDLTDLDSPPKEISCNKAEEMFRFGEDNDVLTSRDFVFIKELICGEPIDSIQVSTGIQGFIGRPGWEKEWMYDIVSNRHSGLDVDKMDYFARDSRRSFGDGRVDEVVVEEAVVAWGKCTAKDGCCELCLRDDGRPHRGQQLMICYPEKAVKALINFFNERFKLHDTVYWHKTTVGAGHMVNDILCYADPYFMISAAPYPEKPVSDKSSNPEIGLPISRAGLDARSFVRLTDNVIYAISISGDENLAQARELACRYLFRDLYKCPAQHSIDRQDPVDLQLWEMSEEEIKQSLLDENGRHAVADGRPIHLLREDFIVDKFTIHHGQKDRNPMVNVRVVRWPEQRKLSASPAELPTATPPSLEQFKGQTPIDQQQSRIRVFCRNNTKYDLLTHVFEQWISRIRDKFCPSPCPNVHEVTAAAVSQSLSQSPCSPDRSLADRDSFDDLDGSPQIFVMHSPDSRNET